jgi:hypothetical protein
MALAAKSLVNATLGHGAGPEPAGQPEMTGGASLDAEDVCTAGPAGLPLWLSPPVSHAPNLIACLECANLASRHEPPGRQGI